MFLLQISLLLLLALLLGRLAVRLGMPAVVGELCTGVLLGPSVLDHLAPSLAGWLLPKDPSQFHLLDVVGQLGVLLLVGITGTEVDAALVRRRGSTAARISVAGFIVPLGLGIATGYLLPTSLLADDGDRTVFALFLGVAMCVSAIPVIAKTLIDMNLLHRNIGQLILSAGMVDDVFGWLMLSVVSAMATTGLHAGEVGLSLTYLAAVLILAALVGRPIVRVALRMSARSSDSGPVVATAVVLVLLGAAATHALGLEAVFGAFVVGILIGTCAPSSSQPATTALRPPTADSSGRTKQFTLARLAPLRAVVLGVLAPLFFATAGLRMDLTALGEPVVLAAAILVLAVAILGKFAGAYIGARASRMNRWEALALGAGMNARGVIEVIVAMVGLRLGVLSTAAYTIIVLVAIATSLMAPPLLRYAMRRVDYTSEEQLRERNHDQPDGAASTTRSKLAEGPGT
ncbi:cation:proton antiporter [Micromonospora sp. WMMC250]|uniref:cation:proton antiporter n=1 Tax=Micromonospora sp. WMMC250 TaxID=3014781 RepID=UPI0022B5FB7D|nr:cation:proton antiporter [Micromonospora sp. WMMC250]MCZ7373258.1 cation:proton antiporter [Micromonospora sp. WMMC250]MCZ7373297.1 cation:proton antiporter [Micromonospora sp. WMMC250]MCZ7379908.1 cation:proton antiporter [Micromonospora sp. WMMC250]